MVCLQAISSIPVSTTFHKGFGSVDIFLHAKPVTKEYADANDGENQVDFRAEDASFFEDGFIGGEGFFLSRQALSASG